MVLPPEMNKAARKEELKKLGPGGDLEGGVRGKGLLARAARRRQECAAPHGSACKIVWL